MTEEEDLRRVKQIPLTHEFARMIFEHPNNYYVESGIPEGSILSDVHRDFRRDMWYLRFQNDDWDAIDEGAKIPEFYVEFRELFCQQCDEKMMYDEESEEQYCPNCERRFQGKVSWID